MSFQFMSRLAAAVVVAVGVGRFVAAELKGDYHIEFTVEGSAYSGMMTKATPGAKGEFTATLAITSPTNISGEFKGRTFGDSVTYEGKYTDKDRGCTGTISGRGTVEKDGSKASGAADIGDSCSGAISAAFRIWR